MSAAMPAARGPSKRPTISTVTTMPITASARAGTSHQRGAGLRGATGRFVPCRSAMKPIVKAAAFSARTPASGGLNPMMAVAHAIHSAKQMREARQRAMMRSEPARKA